MDEKKVISLIGLARKADKVFLGREAVQSGLRAKRIRLVILAKDASSKVSEAFTKHSAVPVRQFSTKLALGHALGRLEVAVLGISEKQFAEAILRHLEEPGS